MRHNGQRQVTASLGGALVTSPTIHTAVPLVSETTNVSTGRGVKSGWGRGKSGPVWKREIKLGDVESGIICDIILNIPRNLTILKLARDLQHVLSSQDPLTPWHLHSTFMFRSSSWKKIGLVLLHSFKLFSFLSFYRFDAVFLGRLTMAAAEWCWFEFERNLFAPIPSLPYYCGCREIMESTFHIFCLWHPHFDVPMFQSRAKKESAEMTELVKITVMILHSLVVFSMECSFSSLLIELVVF